MEYNTIMYTNRFVDIERLNKGLFATDRPILFDAKLSQEEVLNEYIEEIIMDGKNKMFLNTWIDNFNKCTFTKIQINII